MPVHCCYKCFKFGTFKGELGYLVNYAFQTQECSLKVYRDESFSRKEQCKRAVGNCKTAAVWFHSRLLFIWWIFNRGCRSLTKHVFSSSKFQRLRPPFLLLQGWSLWTPDNCWNFLCNFLISSIVICQYFCIHNTKKLILSQPSTPTPLPTPQSSSPSTPPILCSTNIQNLYCLRWTQPSHWTSARWSTSLPIRSQQQALLLDNHYPQAQLLDSHCPHKALQ